MGQTDVAPMQKIALYVAAIFFTVGAIAHLVRLIAGIEIIIGGFEVPVWMSFPGAVVATALAAWMAIAARRFRT